MLCIIVFYRLDEDGIGEVGVWLPSLPIPPTAVLSAKRITPEDGVWLPSLPIPPTEVPKGPLLKLVLTDGRPWSSSPEKKIIYNVSVDPEDY